MLQDIHEATISIPVDINTLGDNSIVVADPIGESCIYIHEVSGTPAGAVTIQILAGTRLLAEFDLVANQGLTLDDIPGHDGVPRFKCLPGENFIINLSAGVQFTGTCVYSRRY